MTDLSHLPASELCTLAKEWLTQLEASEGRYWPLRTVSGETAPEDVIRELIERVKQNSNQTK